MSGLICFTTFLFAAVIAFLLYRMFAAKRASGPMVCGGCGYAVQGLPELTCPECGADLRKVGIVPSAEGASGPRWVAGGAIALVGLFVLMGFASWFLFTARPTGSSPSTLGSSPVPSASIPATQSRQIVAPSPATNPSP